MKMIIKVEVPQWRMFHEPTELFWIGFWTKSIGSQIPNPLHWFRKPTRRHVWPKETSHVMNGWRSLWETIFRRSSTTHLFSCSANTKIESDIGTLLRYIVTESLTRKRSTTWSGKSTEDHQAIFMNATLKALVHREFETCCREFVSSRQKLWNTVADVCLVSSVFLLSVFSLSVLTFVTDRDFERWCSLHEWLNEKVISCVSTDPQIGWSCHPHLVAERVEAVMVSVGIVVEPAASGTSDFAVVPSRATIRHLHNVGDAMEIRANFGTRASWRPWATSPISSHISCWVWTSGTPEIDKLLVGTLDGSKYERCWSRANFSANATLRHFDDSLKWSTYISKFTNKFMILVFDFNEISGGSHACNWLLCVSGVLDYVDRSRVLFRSCSSTTKRFFHWFFWAGSGCMKSCFMNGLWTAHFTRQIFSHLHAPSFQFHIDISFWRAAHISLDPIFMRSWCGCSHFLRLLHFPLFAVPLLSYRLVHLPGLQLLLPCSGGKAPCAH